MEMNRKSLDFIVFIMYQLADSWHMPVYKVYDVLNRSGALDEYLIPCYDVLHTLGSEYLVEDLTGYVEERGYQV